VIFCGCCNASVSANAPTAVYLRELHGEVVGLADYRLCKHCVKRARKHPERVAAGFRRRWEADHPAN
jgi:hypothetical protein